MRGRPIPENVETPSVNLPVGLPKGLPKGRKVQVAVIIVREDRLAPVTAIHHVVNCPKVLNSQLPSHPSLCILDPVKEKSILMEELSK
jgi:hypothetical protein